MKDLFESTDKLCNLINLKFKILSKSIDKIKSEDDYKSICSDLSDTIIDLIDDISILFAVLVKEMQRACKRAWRFCTFLKENNKMYTVNIIDHCICNDSKWKLCTQCLDAEDMMIDIECLSDLKNPGKIIKENMSRYVECVRTIGLKQYNLIYFTQRLKSKYTELNTNQIITYPPLDDADITNKCKICMNSYDMEFITIECGHNFCVECIKSISDSSFVGNSSLQCPICHHSISEVYVDIINQSWIEHLDWL